MHTLALTLLAFVAWNITLVAAMLSWRGILILIRKNKINEFPAGERHGSDTYWRLSRAHMNAVENLPILAAVVVAAGVTEQAHPGTVAGLAWLPLWGHVVIGARIAQSITHVSSGSQLAITVRFIFFFAQLIAFALLCLVLAPVLLA
jgi:hypothetical protein